MNTAQNQIPLRDLLRSASSLLSVTEHETPRHEVMKIWGALSGESLGDVILDNDRLVDATLADEFLTAVGRRAGGEPEAYVTGKMGFRMLELHTDSRALIPRPETETVVEEALAKVRSGVAVDVGTGTGAIALSLSREGAFARVIGIDNSPDALALARENEALTGQKVEWIEGDLVTPLIERDMQVDLLVSNPPYLTEEEYGTLDRSVRDFEPKSALVSGEDGMGATRRLLENARLVVCETGWIVIEVDSRRAATAAALAEELGWVDVLVRDDLFGRARCLLARRGKAG